MIETGKDSAAHDDPVQWGLLEADLGALFTKRNSTHIDL